jgi:hypothetical protein
MILLLPLRSVLKQTIDANNPHHNLFSYFRLVAITVASHHNHRFCLIVESTAPDGTHSHNFISVGITISVQKQTFLPFFFGSSSSPFLPQHKTQ